MSADQTVGPPQISGLRYKALLGSGGFAHVYRYEQTALGRDVAVKVIHGFDEAARRYFSSEASLMARLSSHPHVIPVYQVGECDDSRPYLVMQLCPPPNLMDRLRARPLPVSEVLQIGVQLAGAVETAHRLGILHRDIKPANILFSEYGRPLLTDFGIAQSLEQTAEPVPAFSPAWAPPEQAIGQGFAPSADVYSLCATLWAALAGKVPLGPNRPGLSAQPTGRADVASTLEDLLLTGMSEEVGQRPATALGLGRALQQEQSRLGLAITPIELWNGTDQQDQTVAADPDDRTRLVTLAEPRPGQTLPDPAPDAPAGASPGAATPAATLSTTTAPTADRTAAAHSTGTAVGGPTQPHRPDPAAYSGQRAPWQEAAGSHPTAAPPYPIPSQPANPHPTHSFQGPGSAAGASPQANPRGDARRRRWLALLLLGLLALLVSLALWRFLPGPDDGPTPSPGPVSSIDTPRPSGDGSASPGTSASTTPATAPTGSTTSAGPSSANSSLEPELGGGGFGG
ncbi:MULTISPECIES: protein kinase domain-containing protein [unclassified Luteococcus]|uniref:protein kinase domain-containing protein n=1 Tax=unclassified Luteococcus TaxID=2639923 RepID=UPI00313E1AEE